MNLGRYFLFENFFKLNIFHKRKTEVQKMTSSSNDNDWQRGLESVEERDLYLLNNNQFTDCSFIVGDEGNTRRFECHRLYLAKTSAPLAAQLYGPMKEKEIRVTDISADAFELLLKYIYKGNIDIINFDVACELLYAAKKYLLHDNFVSQCSDFIKSNISFENVWSTFEYGKKMNDRKIEDTALQIIKTHATRVLIEPGFLEIESATLMDLLKQDTLVLGSEVELFEASVRWTRRDLTRRGLDSKDKTALRNSLSPFLKHLRLLSLTNDQLAKSAEFYDAFTGNDLAMIFQSLNLETSAMTEEFCHEKKPRDSNVNYFGQIAIKNPNGGFDIVGIPYSEITSITDWTNFDFCNVKYIKSNAVFQNLEVDSQYKPNNVPENSSYEEDITLVVIDTTIDKVLIMRRLKQNVCYEKFITIKCPSVLYKRNLKVGAVYHKSGNYEKYICHF